MEATKQDTELAGPPSGYAQCKTGRHWGPFGAAGILLYAYQGEDAYVLLNLRSKYVQNGSTWSTPGGAIERGETPWDGARAEVAEELSGLGRRHLTVTETVRATCPGCGWTYTTFVVQLGNGAGYRLPGITRTSGADKWESDSVEWVPVGRVAGLKLHPAFRTAWPTLAGLIPSPF